MPKTIWQDRDSRLERPWRTVRRENINRSVVVLRIVEIASYHFSGGCLCTLDDFRSFSLLAQDTQLQHSLDFERIKYNLVGVQWEELTSVQCRTRAYVPALPAPHVNSLNTPTLSFLYYCHHQSQGPRKVGRHHHHVIHVVRTHPLRHFMCSNHASKSTSKLSNPSYNHPSRQTPLAISKLLNSCCKSHRKGLPNRAT